MAVDLPARIWIYRLRKSHVREEGKARVVDVSLGDAHLAEIQLEKKTIPSELFRMVLEVDRERKRISLSLREREDGDGERPKRDAAKSAGGTPKRREPVPFNNPFRELLKKK